MRLIALCVYLLASLAVPVNVAEAEEASKGPLVIATKVSPPFAMKEADGQWTGISIELWERVAEELDLPPASYREMPLDQMFAALEANQVSVAVAAISMTPEREQRSRRHTLAGAGVR